MSETDPAAHAFEDMCVAMTPKCYGKRIRDEGPDANERQEGVFLQVVGDIWIERQALACIIGQAKNRRDQ